ncbi:hypothetical protein F4824DRAFT_251387 [Ustulina deusta]|nr:hypothetical protein F4824DRAFT_251387 [Ustulina deusta]
MRAFLPTPLLFALLLQTGSSVAIDNDFSAYPEGAQSCLYDSADKADCTSGLTGADLNNCLCKNKNNFVYNTAVCVAKKSPSDIDAVYKTLSSNCAGTGVTLAVSEEAFLAAAAAATQTTSTPSPTTTAPTTAPTPAPPTTSTPTSTSTTSSPTDSSGQGSVGNGLSTGTKIGIGVGVGFGAIAAALAAWFIWAYQRRQRSAHSVHSNEGSGGGAGTSYDGAGAFAMMNASHHEYSRQQGAAELAPVAWKPSSGYPMSGYTASGDKNGGTAGVPLLAELGTESEARQGAVELPTTPGYLGYSDRAPGNANEPVTPGGLSPATYSQSGRGDLSPFTPSRSSEAEYIR